MSNKGLELKFTEYVKDKYQGIDLVGVRSPGNAMQRLLLPGISASTGHPRYYSIFCWAVKQFLDRNPEGKEVEKKAFQLFFYKIENIVIASANEHDHDDKISGVIGATSYDKIRVKGEGLDLVHNEEIRRLSNSAWTPQFYKPSSKELGLVFYEGGATPALYEGLGEALADAFNDNLPPEVSNILKKYLDGESEHMSEKEFQVVCPYFCLCKDSFSTKERDVLHSAVIGGAGISDKHLSELQQSSFQMFLKFLDAGKLTKGFFDFRDKVVEKEYLLSENEKPYVQGWSFLWLRKLLQASLEAIVTCIHENYMGESFDQNSLARFIDNECSRVGKNLGFEVLMSSQDVFSQVDQSVDDQFQALYENLVSANKEKNVAKTFESALVLFIKAFVKMKELSLQKNSIITEMAQYGGPRSLGNRYLFKLWDERLSSSSFKEFVKYLSIELALNHHFSTAQRKYFEVGTYSFRFESNEEGFAPVGEFYFGTGSEKYWSIESMLVDLGIAVRTADFGIEISQFGKTFLRDNSNGM